MKKYIIPQTIVVVADGSFMEMSIHNELGNGQLNNGGFFDDLDDGMDNTFKTKRLWDEDEAR